MGKSISIQPKHRPVLDPDFLPAVLWNRAYRETAWADDEAQPLAIALERRDGTISVFRTLVLPHKGENIPLNRLYVERLLKFLLWQKGGCRIRIGGNPAIAQMLREIYSPDGPRAFDHQFMGEKVYGTTMQIEDCLLKDMPEARESSVPLGRNLDGCRIGFDLGGSDRKCAALREGEVVYSEEIPWDPYFQKDPAYHLEGIQDSLERAAAHLPRIDAIGGSAAGVYVNNEVRAASLFRGVPAADFEKRVRRIFFELRERWGNVPFDVVNDGEVTALAGSMSMNDHAVLGLSMGTSEAAGYVDPEGHITPWLNELAFAPVDYREDAPVDEWSGDAGCGVQYFSQQCVGRLIPAAGIGEIAADLPLPDKLKRVQTLMAGGDGRAEKIYRTIGAYFGYSIAHYAEFYDFRNLLILGRVTSGRGGDVVIEKAREVLIDEFPSLAAKLRLLTPEEKDKRHGQAIAAASLPRLSKA